MKVKTTTIELALMKKLIDAEKLPSKFAIRLFTIINLANNKTEAEIVESFQFCTDEHFEEKLKDVVGLYMNPPNNAILLCVDEKSQIHRTKVRALERSTPILPILQNVPEFQSHDYFRNGNTTLFAALDLLTGKVIGECSDTMYPQTITKLKTISGF
jgi:hypothetical protein